MLKNSKFKSDMHNKDYNLKDNLDDRTLLYVHMLPALHFALLITHKIILKQIILKKLNYLWNGD